MTLQTVDAHELFYGFPVFVLTYPDERVGWNMTACSSSFALRQMLVFGVRATGGASSQIKRAGECTLSVVGREQMPIVERLGRLHGSQTDENGTTVGVDKIAASGAETAVIPGSHMRYLEGAQLVFDLTVESVHDALKETVFITSIRGQYADERLMSGDGDPKELLSNGISPVLFVGADKLMYKYFSSNVDNFGDFREGQ